MDDLLCCLDAEEERLLSDKLLPLRIQLSTLQLRHFARPALSPDSNPGPGPGPDASPAPSPSPCLSASIDHTHPLLRLYQRVYLKFCSVQGRVWDLSAYGNPLSLVSIYSPIYLHPGTI